MKNEQSLKQRGAFGQGSGFRAPCLSGAAGLLALLVSGPAIAADYYVAPTGSDSATGSLAAPFKSLQKGHDVAVAGDTVWLRGGTYKPTAQIKLSKSGQSDTQRIKFFAYQSEVPVIDFSGYVSTNPAVDTPALLVTGNWLHLKGLEIAHVPVGASGAHSISTVRSEGASNNTFELLNIHDGFGPGLFISKGTGGNLLLNCDSHDNYDKDGSQGDGQNADGFGVHYQTTGPSTIVRGCRAWLNSDDGYDLISQEVPVRIEGSWAVQNGFSDGGAGKPSSGNGNGFKAGSSETGIRHILQNNVAWKNRAAGFYANHSTGGNTWLNNTSYMNAVQYNLLASPAGDPNTTITLSGALAHKMRNNVGFPNKNTNMTGVDSASNTWDLNIAEASTDFVSTSDTGFDGPRQADGSMPALGFLKLRAGSPLIDKGTDVGLPYVGAAPDLGADEYGAVSASGAGGASAGGASAGGAASASAGAGGLGTSSAGSAGARMSAGGASGGLPGSAGGSLGTGTGGFAGPGGASPSSAGSLTGGGGAPGPAGSTAGSSSAEPTASDAAKGCACRLSSQATRGPSALWLAVTALGLLAVRRRRGSL